MYQETFIDLLLDNSNDLVLLFNENNELLLSNNSFNKHFNFKLLFKNKKDIKKHFPPKTNGQYLNAYAIKSWFDLLLAKNKNYNLILEQENKTFEFKIKAIKSKDLTIVILKNISKINSLRKKQIRRIKLESIGKMFAGMSHEINTPLTIMKNNLELLELELEEKSAVNKQNKHHINAIKSSITRMENIVRNSNELLKKSPNERKNYNLYAVLIQSLSLFFHHSKNHMNIFINNKAFSLDSRKDDEKIFFDFNKDKIEQVFLIILSNAYDEFFKSKKELKQRVLNIFIYQNKKNIIITFRDNAGTGINKDIINEIFEPFVSTKDYSGIGLGLNIAQKIIKEHKGSIKAYNQKQEAVFEIHFKTTP